MVRQQVTLALSFRPHLSYYQYGTGVVEYKSSAIRLRTGGQTILRLRLHVLQTIDGSQTQVTCRTEDRRSSDPGDMSYRGQMVLKHRSQVLRSIDGLQTQAICRTMDRGLSDPHDVSHRGLTVLRPRSHRVTHVSYSGDEMVRRRIQQTAQHMDTGQTEQTTLN